MHKLPTRKQVIEALFEKWIPEDRTEMIPVDEALNRVLARDYTASCTIPVVRASSMDGVAVMSGRFQSGMPDTSGWKNGEDFCRADTGDDFDDRYDAVIPIEAVNLTENGVLTIQPDVKVTQGMNIRPAGSTIREGDQVGKKGRRLRPFDLSCLAMGNISEVEVYRKPRVAFLPTGNELVPPGAEVRRGNNIDSNSILAKSMLRVNRCVWR